MEIIYFFLGIITFTKKISMISIIIMELITITCEIAGALGAIGTFGAFIFLFFKDKQKQEQIDRLTDATRELTQFQLLLKNKTKI